MYIEFTKDHPSGFKKGASLEAQGSFGERMIEEGYAKEVDKKSFDKLPSNAELVRKLNKEELAKKEAEEADKLAKNEPCEECGKKKNGTIEINDLSAEDEAKAEDSTK